MRFVDRCGVLRALAGVVAAFALVVGGCTPSDDAGRPTQKPTAAPSKTSPSPQARAKVLLRDSLDYLANSPVVHYEGQYSLGPQPVRADLRVSRGGVAHGTMADSDIALDVLALHGQTYIRAPSSFWLGLAGRYEDQRKKARYYAARWIKVDPALLSDPARQLSPASMARRITLLLDDSGVSDIRTAVVRGMQVTRMSARGSTFYVTDSVPHRLVRLVPAPGLLSKPTARGLVRPTAYDSVRRVAPVGYGAPEDEGSLDLTDLDPPGVDDFYRDTRAEVKKLRDSINSQVQFNARSQPNFVCESATFTCTAIIQVTNTVQGGPDVVRTTGTVHATLQGTIAATGLGVQPCADSATMPPNGSASMRCFASFPKPPPSRYPRTYPVEGQWFVVARAILNVTVLLRDLDRAADSDRDAAQCRPGSGSRPVSRGAQRDSAASRQLLGPAPNPTAPINLYRGDYRARIDPFNVRGQASFEIHVYYKNKEIGFFGSNGPFRKHGLGIEYFDKLPKEVQNRLKGIAVDLMRGNRQLTRRDSVQGDDWKRPRIC